MKENTYVHLIEKVHFQDLFLKDIHISRYPLEVEENLSANVNFSSHLEYFDDSSLIASVEFSLSADTLEEETLFTMDFEYIVVYSIEGLDEKKNEPTREDAELFVDKNVPINVWPFAREFVSDMTGRIGVPRLMIGMLRQMPFDEETVNENDTD